MRARRVHVGVGVEDSAFPDVSPEVLPAQESAVTLRRRWSVVRRLGGRAFKGVAAASKAIPRRVAIVVQDANTRFQRHASQP